jgi:hypothetical protein
MTLRQGRLNSLAAQERHRPMALFLCLQIAVKIDL